MTQAQSNVSSQSSTSPMAGNLGDDEAIRQCIAAFVSAWNKHDPRQMAACWAQDGDLINPFGRPAQGRLKVEQLFTEEQQGPMKQSTHQMNITSVRPIAGDLALVDAECNITGIRGPDGKEMPVFTPHVFLAMSKKDGNWSILSARAFAFMPRPGSAQ
jgi:uncharacterized protein (TIGR02246 family)